MNEMEITLIRDFANVWLLFVFALVTTYCKCRLEIHMKSKYRWKVLLSAIGLLLCAVIGAIFYYQIGWTEYAKTMYTLNLGAIAVIFFIGFPKKLFRLPKKKKSN